MLGDSDAVVSVVSPKVRGCHSPTPSRNQKQEQLPLPGRNLEQDQAGVGGATAGGGMGEEGDREEEHTQTSDA